MMRNRKFGSVWALMLAVFVTAFAALLAAAQQQQQQQQSVPDAPSVSRNPATIPPLPRANPASSTPAEEPPPPDPDKAGSSSSLAKPDAAAPTPDAAPPPPGPSATMTKPTSTPTTGGNSTDDVYKLVSNVSFVVVPVTVRDDNGHLVDGLLKRDFTIKEDGAPQNIQFFSSDPFPLSAAIVIDTGLPDTELRKIQDTLPALAGAFSGFDEVSIYIFGNSVQQVSDFSAAADKLDAALRKVRATKGTEGGVTFAGGPFNTTSPVVNGKQVDPNAAIVPVVRPESHVLNDAILAAANDLSRRPRTRRRMLFVISDGRELRSRASYQDVLKVLLSHEVAVYPLVVSSSALPVYNKLERIRIPGQGYGDILPKYASATGTGNVLVEFSAKGIEGAYAQAAAQARNEYTIGYTTRATAASNYRTIEVVVHRPNLKVYAKDGYYPLPPERNNRPQ
jgi:VWFA-related protein